MQQAIYFPKLSRYVPQLVRGQHQVPYRRCQRRPSLVHRGRQQLQNFQFFDFLVGMGMRSSRKTKFPVTGLCLAWCCRLLRGVFPAAMRTQHTVAKGKRSRSKIQIFKIRFKHVATEEGGQGIELLFKFFYGHVYYAGEYFTNKAGPEDLLAGGEDWGSQNDPKVFLKRFQRVPP